jgi:hypothetical protein
VTTGADGDAQASAAKSVRGVTLGNIAKISVALALVVTGSFAVMRTVGHSSEQPKPTQPSASARLSAPPSVLAPVPSSIAATRVATPALNVRSTSVKGARSGSSPLIRSAARHLRSHAAPAKRASSSSYATASSVASLESDETAPAKPSPPSSREPIAHAAERSTPAVARIDASDDARAELALVERIHAAMRADNPSLALALCAKHELDWPRGTFALEREGLRAIALCDLRSNHAEAHARTFLADHPSTPLAPRVAAACAAQLSAASDAPGRPAASSH